MLDFVQQVPKYWRTVRHLRPIQIYGRLWFHSVRPKIGLNPSPSLRTSKGRPWVRAIGRSASMVSSDQFFILNREISLTAHGWDDPALAKLWRYNLHYFDDLNAEGAIRRKGWHVELISRWIAENGVGRGSGWEPYPTSLRIVNWIKWSLSGNELGANAIYSLALQARWVMRRLEHHLLGNHLFANAKALIFAGSYFEGGEADRWLETGLNILSRELPRQILGDGGHFERSTMYHALACEDMLDLYNLAGHFHDVSNGRWRNLAVGWRECCAKMLDWLVACCHPDGEISFFNDAAFGVAFSPCALLRYSDGLGVTPICSNKHALRQLEDSGYVRVESNTMVALLDVAPIGPDYLPGHAHADTLSFELSLFGERVFVNSGTSCYGDDAERHRQRGTRAHNTVTIDDKDSSEVWAGFRVGRRAYPTQLEICEHADRAEITCGHTGYRHLPGRNLHRRTWIFEEGVMMIEDLIEGAQSQAEARFHLHPQVQPAVDSVDPAKVRLAMKSGKEITFAVESGVVHVERSSWHPRFGVTLPSTCLVVPIMSSQLRTFVKW